MQDDLATKSDVSALVSALELRIAERMDANELKTLERLQKVETRLLTEFQKWASTTEGRLRVYEYGSISLTERMLAIEEKVRGIDRRTGGKLI